MQSTRPQREVVWAVLVAAVLISAAGIALVRQWYPQYWFSIRRQLLGPFDGVPLVRGEYLWCLAAVFAVDLAVLRRRSAIAMLGRFGASERTDIVYAVGRYLGLGLVVPLMLTGGFSSVGPQLLTTWRAGADRIPSLPTVANPLVQLLIYMLISDFLRYWWHRLSHDSVILWRFHAFHHSATSFTILTGNRLHPVEFITAAILVTVPLILLGATAGQVLLVVLIRRVVDIAQHSMVPFRYGWVGRWLVFSPIDHRIHHSNDPVHFDKNFGDWFPIWDHLFSTWYGGETVNEEIGLEGGDYNRDGVIADTLRPFEEAWSDLRARAGRGLSVAEAADGQ